MISDGTGIIGINEDGTFAHFPAFDPKEWRVVKSEEKDWEMTWVDPRLLAHFEKQQGEQPMQVNHYHIANEFTKYPGARFRRLGDFSGEEFRDDVLIPLLQKGKVILNMNDAMGYGCGWLEEVFGGTIRKGIDLTHDNLEIISEHTWCADPAEIWGYIMDAKSVLYMKNKQQGEQNHD